MKNLPNDLSLSPADLLIGRPPAAFAGRGFQGIPGVACTHDGALWACWYGGGKGEGPENFVMMASKPAGADHWSEPWLFVVAADLRLRVFDPVMWVDSQGKLWLFWAQTHVKPENDSVAVFDGLRSNMPDTRFVWDGRGGVWGACCERPETAPRDWSEPRRFCDGIMMNKPVADAAGRWLMPSTIWDLKPYADGIAKAQRGPGVALCSDDGRRATIMGAADIPDAMYDEHVVLPLRDGRWAMWVRNASAVRRAIVSYSSDEGRTWTRGVYTDIPCPNSRFFIGRLQSGALLLISHRITQKMIDSQSLWPVRSHLAAWISDDDGATWLGDLLIDERDAVSYPDATQSADGVIHVVYDRSRNATGEIIHVELTEHQIRDGRADIHRSIVNHFGK
jgi:predicted neuraminidase